MRKSISTEERNTKSKALPSLVKTLREGGEGREIFWVRERKAS